MSLDGSISDSNNLLNSSDDKGKRSKNNPSPFGLIFEIMNKDFLVIKIILVIILGLLFFIGYFTYENN